MGSLPGGLGFTTAAHVHRRAEGGAHGRRIHREPEGVVAVQVVKRVVRGQLTRLGLGLDLVVLGHPKGALPRNRTRQCGQQLGAGEGLFVVVGSQRGRLVGVGRTIGLRRTGLVSHGLLGGGLGGVGAHRSSVEQAGVNKAGPVGRRTTVQSERRQHLSSRRCHSRPEASSGGHRPPAAGPSSHSAHPTATRTAKARCWVQSLFQPSPTWLA